MQSSSIALRLSAIRLSTLWPSPTSAVSTEKPSGKGFDACTNIRDHDSSSSSNRRKVAAAFGSIKPISRFASPLTVSSAAIATMATRTLFARLNRELLFATHLGPRWSCCGCVGRVRSVRGAICGCSGISRALIAVSAVHYCFLFGLRGALASSWPPHCSLLCVLSYATLGPPYASHGNAFGFPADP